MYWLEWESSFCLDSILAMHLFRKRAIRQHFEMQWHSLVSNCNNYSNVLTYRIRPCCFTQHIFHSQLRYSLVRLTVGPDCFLQPRLIGNTCLYIHFCKTEKNLPICTIPCSFQLKSTLEAVKLWQLLFLLTRSMTYRNSFEYFLTVTCRMVCYDF